MSTTITTRACRRNSYIPGCSYLFVDLAAAKETATITIKWGSVQGGPSHEEHGREEYTRRGNTAADAVESVRDVALEGNRDNDEIRQLIEEASSEALQAAVA
jgi:hypothetical protein